MNDSAEKKNYSNDPHLEALRQKRDEGNSGANHDITSLLSNIKERVTKEINSSRASKRSNGSLLHLSQASLNGKKQFTSGHLINSSNLRHLNKALATPLVNPNQVKTHRKGIIGKIIVKIKQRFQRLFWNFLEDYFQQEREFNSHLVRYLNENSRYVDERDGDIFWELIRKIDNDIRSVHLATSRMNEETRGESYRRSEDAHQRINELYNQVARHSHEFSTKINDLESVVHGLEAILANRGTSQAITEVAGSGEVHAKPTNDNFYLLFENRFRGSEELVRERIKENLDILNCDNILEIGCGRGEFLQYCREHDIVATGIDIERSMVELCQSKNLHAILGDAMAVLPTFSDDFFGGALAIQVVEHLPFDKLRDMLLLMHKKLAPGARVILETPNPRSVVTLTNNYYRDPTHFNPVHPDTLKYLCDTCGFKRVEIVKRSPFPESAMLPMIKDEYYFSYAQKQMANQLNNVINRLNDLCYGHQDYAVIAEK